VSTNAELDAELESIWARNEHGYIWAVSRNNPQLPYIRTWARNRNPRITIQVREGRDPNKFYFSMYPYKRRGPAPVDSPKPVKVPITNDEWREGLTWEEREKLAHSLVNSGIPIEEY
jgi:hypothetical protein